MKSLLHTLNNSESILLMYLFNELPPDDRAEVEEMVRSDVGLRAELERLAAVHETVSGLIENSDSAALRPGMFKTVQRDAARAMDQWNAQRLLAIPEEPAQRRGLKWVAYSSGIAALLLVGFLFYWGMKPDVSTDNLPSENPGEWAIRVNGVIGTFDNPSDTDELNEAALVDAQIADDSELLRKSLDPSDDLLNDSLKHRDLNAAEQEINAVAQLSDPSTINGDWNFQ